MKVYFYANYIQFITVAFLGTVLLYLISGYLITRYYDNSLELFTSSKSKIALLSLSATIEKPLNKVVRSKVLVRSSIFEKSRPSFTLFGEVFLKYAKEALSED